MTTLARWQAMAQDDAGNVLQSPTVEVRLESTNALAFLFSDRAGTVALGNPFTAALDGLIAFHVTGGAYKIIITKGGVQRTLRYVAIGTAQEYDANTTPGFDPSVFALRANNLNDLASIPTARTNLGISTVGNTGAYADLTGKPTLGSAAALNAGTGASQVLQLNASAQYPANDGQLIANVAKLSSTTPVISTVITARNVSGSNIANNGNIAGSGLGWVSYSLSGGCTPTLNTNPGALNLPGTWKNITGQTTNIYDEGVWVRVA